MCSRSLLQKIQKILIFAESDDNFSLYVNFRNIGSVWYKFANSVVLSTRILILQATAAPPIPQNGEHVNKKFLQIPLMSYKRHLWVLLFLREEF